MSLLQSGPQEWLTWLPRSIAFLFFFTFSRLQRRIVEKPNVSNFIAAMQPWTRSLLMPYTWLYVFFGMLVFEDIFVSVSSELHDNPDGGIKECFTNSTLPAYSNHQFKKQGMEQYLNEAGCRTIPPALYVLSLWAAPISLVLCFIVCAVHTMQHGRECEFKPLNYGHDMATQISSLPIVYALLSFKSIVSIWDAMANGKLIEYDMQTFDINYSVADCYEAWALYCFGRICMDYLQNVSSWDNNEARDLMSPLQKLTLQGVGAFCLIQLGTAMYSMFVSYFFASKVCQIHPSACTLEQYFTGAVFALSCLAICNLVIFETTLGAYVHGLKPKFKFVYAKVLLSITCMQRAVLSVVAPWMKLTQLENDLLYASLVCIECLMLSLVNWHAWHPKADWHKKVIANPRARARARESEMTARASTPQLDATNSFGHRVSTPAAAGSLAAAVAIATGSGKGSSSEPLAAGGPSPAPLVSPVEETGQHEESY